jgi:hypothetical protein
VRLRVGSLVLVEWDDAWGPAPQLTDDEVLQTETVGWVARKTGRSLYVANERFPGRKGEQRWRGITRIPMGMVTRIVRIA